MIELEQKVKAILKLDKKRTQGDWQYSAGGYLPGCGDYDCSSIYLLDGVEKHIHPETGEDLIFEVAGTIILGEDGECLSEDIEFMSLAPEMASIIKDLTEQNDALQQTNKIHAETNAELTSEFMKAQTQNEKLATALKGLSDLYTHAFDLSDGGLIMLPDSVKIFEKRHAMALKALGITK